MVKLENKANVVHDHVLTTSGSEIGDDPVCENAA
jgi:hypothetical protein